ncbi:STAS domain-containing protein [Streptomyces sp. NPDC003456]|uniref:STAS domain-containing protein n=1 Tax=Streptomyces sp. NPDC003456 TaxID=3364683 RepID=UPI0036C703A7
MSAPFDTKVHVSHHDLMVRITVSGELDHEDAEDVEAAWQVAERAGLPTTTVDLSRVTFADSMLLNALLAARHRHLGDGRRLVLLGPLPPSVHRLLEISGTLEHFTVRNTHETGDRDDGRPHECGRSG